MKFVVALISISLISVQLSVLTAKLGGIEKENPDIYVDSISDTTETVEDSSAIIDVEQESQTPFVWGITQKAVVAVLVVVGIGFLIWLDYSRGGSSTQPGD